MLYGLWSNKKHLLTFFNKYFAFFHLFNPIASLYWVCLKYLSVQHQSAKLVLWSVFTCFCYFIMNKLVICVSIALSAKTKVLEDEFNHFENLFLFHCDFLWTNYILNELVFVVALSCTFIFLEANIFFFSALQNSCSFRAAILFFSTRRRYMSWNTASSSTNQIAE